MNFVIVWGATYLLSFLLVLIVGLASFGGIVNSFTGNISWINHVFHILESGIVALIGLGLSKAFSPKEVSLTPIKFRMFAIAVALAIFVPLLYWQSILFTVT